MSLPSPSPRDHRVVFDLPSTTWEDALTVGNGRMAANVWHPENRIEMAINHLDATIFFNESVASKPLDLPITHPEFVKLLKAREWEELDRIWYGNRKQAAEPRDPLEMVNKRGVSIAAVAAWLQLELAFDKQRCRRFIQTLDLASGTIRYEAETERGEAFQLDILTDPVEDWIAIEFSWSGKGSPFRDLRLCCPPFAWQTVKPRGFVHGNVAGWVHEHQLSQIRYAVGLRAELGEGRFVKAPEGLRWKGTRPGAATGSLRLHFDSTRAGDGVRERLSRSLASPPPLADLRQRNVRHWDAFWGKSKISLPDPFLERLWRLQLYHLAVSNGRGSRVPWHACGMNGIFHPNDDLRWGNGWILDVNPQSTFWGSYTANHVELAEPFYRAVERQASVARELARKFFGMPGAAFCATHGYGLYYHCAGPWYAQFFWWHYLHTGDETFLRERAWPVMREVAAFLVAYLKPDRNGGLHMDPGISPEQGGLGYHGITRDAVIDLACAKYLLKTAAEAAQIMGEADGERHRWEEMSRRIADYPTATTPEGPVLRDSDAPGMEARSRLRHPSLLMPVFPLPELSLEGGEEQKALARRTLRTIEDRTEIVTFAFGWLAATAARLGLGDDALRLLHDRGLMHCLRANGAVAEQTDRFVQELSIGYAPARHPHLMEASGGIVAAVNEMLLQSLDGVLRVFPALPKAWKECCFERLLAVGAHEVSATLRAGRVTEVSILSLRGRPLRLLSPWGGEPVAVEEDGVAVTPQREERILEVPTRTGGVYRFRPASAAPVEPGKKRTEVPEVPSHRTSRGFHLYLGGNRHTRLLETIERFLAPFQMGNSPQRKHNVYRIDFTPNLDAPRAYPILERIYYRPRAGERFPYPSTLHHHPEVAAVSPLFGIWRVGPRTLYHPARRLGWSETGKRAGFESTDEDGLLRDGVSGSRKAEFLLWLPRGQYQALVLLGHPDRNSWTQLTVNGQTTVKPRQTEGAGEPRAAGFTLPVERDALVRFGVSSKPGLEWAWKALLVHRLS